jgi:hypothetical protein
MLPNSNQSPNAAEKLISKYGDYSQKKRDGMNVVIKTTLRILAKFQTGKNRLLGVRWSAALYFVVTYVEYDHWGYDSSVKSVLACHGIPADNPLSPIRCEESGVRTVR